MKHSVYLPLTTPAPTIGSWFYFLKPDSMHQGIEYHSCGRVTRVVPADDETYVEYVADWHPTFSHRPIQITG